MPLDYGQRLARARNIRKYRKKMSIARNRLAKRLAQPEQLEKRARRMAVKMVRRIVAGRAGLKYSQLSVAQKMEIDKRVAKKKGLIDRFAKRLMPKVRKADRERLAQRNQNESIFLNLELTSLFESGAVQDGDFPLDNEMQEFIRGVIDSYISFYGREEAVKKLDQASLPVPCRKYVDDYLYSGNDDEYASGGE
ncbi:putative rIII lysis inhibition accessory protein, rapid lysis phenotype [Ochrobactrum phage vB_OspM_OC]|nr:putative rIII lysis inhibition accessory protein, rapid lysis phenotype [Ochrobactrum phage vB_OspM_OC]